jgi:sulfide:quinone oxidoreductase
MPGRPAGSSVASMTTDPRNVLVAGAGPAGLETALALHRLAGDRVAITLLAPETELVYRPLSVAEPFGGAPVQRFSVARFAADCGFALRHGNVGAVDTRHRSILTGRGETIPYDALVLALGARYEEAVPGALTFRGPRESASVRDALEALPADGAPRVTFIAAPGTGWTLPIYELALHAARWARERTVSMEPWLITHESRPLYAFGERASCEIAELLDDAGIRLWTGAGAERVLSGRLRLDSEGWLPVALAIALPRATGQPLAGIPHDGRGFTRVDEVGRVPGAGEVYAVGDMTSRRLKQGGLATQQADAAASAVAAWAGADVEPTAYRPELRAVLLTGGPPRYLRGASAPTDDPPWWPPHKIAARHLAPYLAAHPELEVPA